MEFVIEIRDFFVDCIIGVYPEERDKVQQVAVNLDLFMQTEDNTFQTDNISSTIDYAWVTSTIEFILVESKFYLLETAVQFIGRYLSLLAISKNDPLIQKINLCIGKNDVPKECSKASVRMNISPKDIHVIKKQQVWGWIDTIGETKSLGLYRLNLYPNSQLSDLVLEESELILIGNLLIQTETTRELFAGEQLYWKSGKKRSYINKGTKVANILCVRLA
ncbi:MAG: dihydroneopterin aldolase [Leptospiraceae bacterium]|nr:dihydroneopterin aldolase [Leptospiraceae bacterium]MCP5497876.1 dihydroneopterin aldolase [Leptospiraceae bacterium]